MVARLRVLGEFLIEPVTREAHPYPPQVRARRTFHDRRPVQSRAVAVQGRYLQLCSSSSSSVVLRPVRGRRTRIKYVIGLTGLAEAFRHTFGLPTSGRDPYDKSYWTRVLISTFSQPGVHSRVTPMDPQTMTAALRIAFIVEAEHEEYVKDKGARLEKKRSLPKENEEEGNKKPFTGHPKGEGSKRCPIEGLSVESDQLPGGFGLLVTCGFSASFPHAKNCSEFCSARGRGAAAILAGICDFGVIVPWEAHVEREKRWGSVV
ncbi:hypothetical protein Taro_027270 [Colocasia esculenta]|uniref:Uncharacterized protein n=1 Tax=Colocasia esculenta TaxID=4460 RepID=A0A843VHL2_COLES|nr:hypothetical protein [Colocasia esculenta]